MNYYKKNLEFIRKNIPNIYNTISANNLQETLVINEAEHNNFLMKLDGKECYANSIYNREVEYSALIADLSRETDALVIFGIGNGEILRRIGNDFPKLKAVYVVEPSILVFKRLMSKFDFIELFYGLGQITLVLENNPVAITSVIVNNMAERHLHTEIICSPSYYSIYGDLFNAVKERLVRELRGILSKYVTLYSTRNRWLRNTIFNLKHYSFDQHSLGKVLDGKPAIIVSAGPSLNKNIHLLEKAKESSVIIAAGSAMKILLKHGITPHFRIAIDADFDGDLYDDDFFDSSSNIPLLYASQLTDVILPKYNGEKIFMLLPTDLIMRFVYRKIEKPIELTRSGASVVISAMSFLAESGASPIVFVGQDMCFYDDQLYASGRMSVRQSNVDESSWIKMKDIYGNEVHTIRSYLQIKYDYEGILDLYKQKFINATEGGLGIKQAENRTLQDVLENELANKININFESEIKTVYESEEETRKLIREELNNIYDSCHKIMKINQQRMLDLSELRDKLNERSIDLGKALELVSEIDDDVERKLTKIEFYDEVMRQSIAIQSMSLKRIYGRNEVEEYSHEYAEKGIQYLLNISTEIEISAQLTVDFLNEAFEDAFIEKYKY